MTEPELACEIILKPRFLALPVNSKSGSMLIMREEIIFCRKCWSIGFTFSSQHIAGHMNFWEGCQFLCPLYSLMKPALWSLNIYHRLEDLRGASRLSLLTTTCACIEFALIPATTTSIACRNGFVGTNYFAFSNYPDYGVGYDFPFWMYQVRQILLQIWSTSQRLTHPICTIMQSCSIRSHSHVQN